MLVVNSEMSYNTEGRSVHTTTVSSADKQGLDFRLTTQPDTFMLSEHGIHSSYRVFLIV